MVAVSLGLAAGTGGYAFHYGKGLSYFSTDPAACANCHIMNTQYDSWQKASHHTSATCVDCHLPHETVPKLASKAENGWLHSKGFTLQDFHEPIFLREKSQDILETNCKSCHGEVMHGALPIGNGRIEEINCLDCHRSVGHGPTTGLGKFDAKEIERYLENLK